jgi:hypothetical protein
MAFQERSTGSQQEINPFVPFSGVATREQHSALFPEKKRMIAEIKVRSSCGDSSPAGNAHTLTFPCV